jgi:adenylyltransferase/sulfurtransferase
MLPTRYFSADVGYCHPNAAPERIFDKFVQKMALGRSRVPASGLTAFFSVTYHAASDSKHEEAEMSFSIMPKELKARLDKGEKLVLLDVREPWEHSLAKLEGSVLIPLGTLPQSLSKLDRNAEIIAYCHHGMRSADATGFLLQQGFSNVKNLVGGIDAWSVQVDGAVPRY